MKRLLFWWIIAAAVLLILSTAWGLIWVFSQRDTVPEGVHATTGNHDGAAPAGDVLHNIRPLSLGGLPVTAALAALAASAQAILDTPLTIEAPNTAVAQKTWTLAELGLQIDFDDAKNTIMELTKGSVMNRSMHRWKFPDQLNVHITWDAQKFEAAIRKQWGYIDKTKPINAIRTISVNNTVHYTSHQDAYRLNIAALFNNALKAAEHALAKQWGKPDVPLHLTLPLTAVHPEFTLKRLKDQGIDRMIASFSTDFSTSDSGRIHNVTAAANTLHDWLLAPDELFDYGKVVEATREKYGFQEAPVIVNGELVPGVGGGICQVSSTLYNAALYAGLSMTERRNHSLPVSYLPKGRDATFAEGAINFRFRNTTGKYLLIRTEVIGRTLTVKLFGTMPANETYKLDSKTVEVVPPPEKTVVSAAVQPGGKVLLTPGKPGYVVETYRTLFRNGKAVSRQRISRDTYKAQPSVFGVAAGETNDAAPAPYNAAKQKALIEDGVSR
ncbi:VanW family protein [Paenibacillus sp. GCM10027626]|uniref:VanW family protein n=1 Tax=Paenibacillus sp. GCM10027626 TaxID=3273411 RepID=UPI0036293E95